MSPVDPYQPSDPLLTFVSHILLQAVSIFGLTVLLLIASNLF